MPDIFDEAAPSDVFDAAEGDVFDQAAHERQQAVSSIESSTLPKSAAPTVPSSARLNLGPSPRSIPEGLQTEQEERRAGAPLVITPQDKVQSVPRPNQSLARPQAPDSSLNYAVPGNEVTGGVTGFFPSRTPRNGPGGQLPATPPLEAAKATLGAIPPQSETELLPGAATELSAAQHLATPGQRVRGATEAVQGLGEAVTPLMGPEVSEIGAAGGAAVKNALRLGAGLGTGIGAQKAGEEISKALGASKDTQELVSQLSFWAPTILGMVGGKYEALPKDAAGRADAVFRNLVYKAGGTVPENATLEQATAAYKQAINNLHPDISPATAQEAQILNAAWTAVKGRYKAGPPVAPPTRAELAEHLDRTNFESPEAAKASYVAEQQAQEAPVAAKPKAPEAEVIPPSKPSPAVPEVAKPIVLEANQVEEAKPKQQPRGKTEGAQPGAVGKPATRAEAKPELPSAAPVSEPSAEKTEAVAPAEPAAKPEIVKGGKVELADGRRATIEYAAPADKLPVVRLSTEDGEKVKLTSQKEIDGLKAATKYKYGSTQADIPESSEAHSSIEAARARISDSDLAGKGKDVGGNHVTVRYGIQSEDVEGVKKYLASLAPFEASLGKTDKFPPSPNSDGAAVIHAPIESPELQKINAELEKHGDFTEPSFKEYRPHATIAYVDPAKAGRYTGMSVTEGKKFPVNEIAITDKNGGQTVVKLEGKKSSEQTPFGRPLTAAEKDVQNQPGTTGVAKDIDKWQPPPELGAFPNTPDVGAKARAQVDKESGPLKRGEERRKVDRTGQQAEDKLFNQAREELGEDATSDQIGARIAELKTSAPEVKPKKAEYLNNGFGPRRKEGTPSAPVGKEPWQMTRAEWMAQRPAGTAPGMHAFYIDKALRKGEDVPPAVLKDYENDNYIKDAIAASPQRKKEIEDIKARVAKLENSGAGERLREKESSFQQSVSKKVADKLRTVADNLEKQIEDKRRPMTQNPTPKRMAEYRSRVIDADEMERTQKAMRALADAHETGTITPDLAVLRSKEEIGRLVHKGLDTSRGGYYDRIPSSEYRDKTPAGKKLQEMIEGAKSPAATAAKLAKEKASKIAELEAQVQFQKLPGYFPTPKAVASRLLDISFIEPGMKVLEPSAGKGDLAELIRQEYPDAKLDVVEQQSKLREILGLKGFNVVGEDFLEHKGQYDRIIMNPPFEKGADVEHVRHAYELLKPGGRLLAIMSPHAEFASDKKSVDFRSWMDDHGAAVENLPTASFKESGTGANARRVTIDKPSEAKPAVAEESKSAQEEPTKAEKTFATDLNKKVSGLRKQIKELEKETSAPAAYYQDSAKNASERLKRTNRINQLSELRSELRDIEQAHKIDLAEKLTPEEKVPEVGKNFEGRYVRASLEPVKAAWLEKWKPQDGEDVDDHWKWMVKNMTDATDKPGDFSKGHLYIKVPDDGSFYIPNNPAAIDYALKAAGKFASSEVGEVLPKGGPKKFRMTSPKEFDNAKYIAGLEKEIKDLENDRYNVGDLQKPYIEEQLKAARENLAEAKQETPEEEARVVPGSRSAKTGNETGKTSIQDLTDSISRQVPEKRPLKDRISRGADIGEKSGDAKDSLGRAYDRIKGAASALWDAYGRPPKWTDYEDLTGKWSGADQINALDLDRFSKAIVRAVPEKLRREAISNWIEAGGDEAVLRDRAEKSEAPYKKGYEAALNLSDAEKTIARNVMNRNDATLEEAQKAGILQQGVENYVRHVYADSPKYQAKVAAEMNFASLQTKPSFTKERKLPTYFDAEQLGFTPKDKDVGYLTAIHERSFREALAARAYVHALMHGKASDGRPLVATSWASAKELSPRDGESSAAYLIKPNIKAEEEFGDYRKLDHPALRGWRWAGKTSEGAPIFVQGDAIVHPEIFRKLKNNLTKSAIRSYETEILGHTVHPGAFVLNTSAEIKHAILSFSGFHQTTLAAHAAEHRTLPVGMPKLDLNEPKQRKLVEHGLMVAQYDAEEAFGEGVASGGLVTKIPGIGPLYHHYTQYLFHSFLPRIKMGTSLNALDRNFSRYEGKLSDDQIYAITAAQGNASFGGLNYRMLGRNKTIQDVLRLGLMAPDFFEARARYAGQAAKPYGREQLVALVGGAVVIYTLLRILNEVTDRDPHWDKPFSVVYRDKEYTMRTIQEDIFRAVTQPGKYFMNRLSPLVSTAIHLGEGRNAFGRKESVGEILKQTAKQEVPIPLQPWTRESKDTNAQKAVETIAKMVGVNMKNAHEASEERLREKERAGRETEKELEDAAKAGDTATVEKIENDPEKLRLISEHETWAGYLSELRKLDSEIKDVKLASGISREDRRAYLDSLRDARKELLRQADEAAKQH